MYTELIPISAFFFSLQEGYECQCCTGFAGSHCEEIDACSPSPCTNNGICVDLSQGHDGNSYQCLCPYGECVAAFCCDIHSNAKLNQSINISKRYIVEWIAMSRIFVDVFIAKSHQQAIVRFWEWVDRCGFSTSSLQSKLLLHVIPNWIIVLRCDSCARVNVNEQPYVRKMRRNNGCENLPCEEIRCSMPCKQPKTNEPISKF